MTLLVIKFGGTSLANKDCILNAAAIIIDLKAQGYQVVVVVSAMAGETDRLASLADSFMNDARPSTLSSAFDVVISAGEQISSGLLALACHSLDVACEPVQGWQLPIVTSSDFSKARIEGVDVSHLKDLLNENITPIVSGFQGVDAHGRITTFGRGGSDVSAVVIAAALGANECRLYKDVDGVSTADPSLVSNTRVLDKISIEEMFEKCSQGAKIIHPRAVEAAMRQDVALRILPTFSDKKKSEGTFIVKSSPFLETENISGIVCNKKEVRFLVMGLPSSPGATTPLFSILSEYNISVDMILLDEHHLSFTVPSDDFDLVLKILKDLRSQLNYGTIFNQKRLAKVSIVGVGLRGHASVANVVGESLEFFGISMYGMTATELKLSILVSEEYADEFVQILHDRFHLNLPLQNRPSLMRCKGVK